MNNTGPIPRERLASLLAELRSRNAAKVDPSTIPQSIKLTPVAQVIQTEHVVTSDELKEIGRTATGRTGESITYNDNQAKFIELATSGKSCVLIGAAGTGKTTCMQGAVSGIELSGKAGIIPGSDTHKYLPTGTPGIVIIAYTRRAVNNIRKVMPENMRGNCITHHKFLEYEPVYDEVEDPVTGMMKKTMRFEATRNRLNPLSSAINTIIIEESSMYSVELEAELKLALPHPVQFIYLGDIQQLPPVFGSAVLGYKMQELPIIELTEVYRQALESPIIRLAHRILSGKPIPLSEYPEWKFSDQLTLHAWKKKLRWEDALMTAAKFFTTAMDSKVYDPDEDTILIPFNKSFGSDELNRYIAQHIAKLNGKVVWEVIAGFQKLYFFEGLKVLYDKEDAVIVKIERNKTYFGKRTQPESIHLDMWGCNQATQNSESQDTKSGEDELDDMDFLLDAVMTDDSGEEDEDRVRAASHSITVRLNDSGRELVINSAGALNNLILSYALTVHKSQGSEWRKVFLVIHQSHATMIQRELLYTGCTRAKKELYVICEPETFTKGILNQRIRGNSLLEKSQYFMGKIAEKAQLSREWK